MIDKLAWTKKPLSWSAISSFEYDKEQWYKSYVLGEKVDNKEMQFGKMIGKKLETDPTFLPMIPRHSKMEHGWRVKFGKIELIGYADSFCLISKKKLAEYKTGKKAWDQKRVNDHGQLTMYCLMNYITNKIKPECMEIQLIWMPTQENGDFSISFIEPIEKKIKIFKTKRTMTDILKFGVRINNVYKDMLKYANEHP